MTRESSLKPSSSETYSKTPLVTTRSNVSSANGKARTFPWVKRIGCPLRLFLLTYFLAVTIEEAERSKAVMSALTFKVLNKASVAIIERARSRVTPARCQYVFSHLILANFLKVGASGGIRLTSESSKKASSFYPAGAQLLKRNASFFRSPFGQIPLKPSAIARKQFLRRSFG